MYIYIYIYIYIGVNPRLNPTHAVSHNICGLCVSRKRCPVVSLSLRLNWVSELQHFSCVLTYVWERGQPEIDMPSKCPPPTGSCGGAFVF